jgi:3-isopropylmalate/(R)-2-methylmalate dehydratase large subunit
MGEAAMGATLAQKILARASGRSEVEPGQYVTANIDLAMMTDQTHGVLGLLLEAGIMNLWDPDKVLCLLDHYAPSPTVESAETAKKIAEMAKKFDIQNFYGQRAGVAHQVLAEKGWIVPGALIVATDSHTTTYGALGAAGTGIGVSEMAFVLATGTLWFRVPETIKFHMLGNLQPGVMSKDVILHIAGKYSTEVAQYKSVEFTGQGAKQMSLASRMTMSNMAMEIGAKFGFFEPDDKVIQYLAHRTDKSFDLVTADQDAIYERTYEIDVSTLEPQVAFPFAVDNVRPISQAGNIKVDQAVLGSCTNGRLEDLRMAARILEGRKVHTDTRLLVIPASAEVYKEALNEGILSTLIEAGGVICNPGCGPCFGAHMGLLASGEACIASINRNFKGRMGSPEARVYLSSPATVAASAIEGKIADPRNYGGEFR